jgi:hypothetical protein
LASAACVPMGDVAPRDGESSSGGHGEPVVAMEMRPCHQAATAVPPRDGGSAAMALPHMKAAAAVPNAMGAVEIMPPSSGASRMVTR